MAGLRVVGNCLKVWQRRWPWGSQVQLLNVCDLVPFVLHTSLQIQSSLLAPHCEGQLCFDGENWLCSFFLPTLIYIPPHCY